MSMSYEERKKKEAKEMQQVADILAKTARVRTLDDLLGVVSEGAAFAHAKLMNEIAERAQDDHPG